MPHANNPIIDEYLATLPEYISTHPLEAQVRDIYNDMNPAEKNEFAGLLAKVLLEM